MRTLFASLLLFLTVFPSCQSKRAQAMRDTVSFYEVPLVCGAAPHIGCGSRIKPLFIDTDKEPRIKESWSNRQGTVIAIVWNESDPEPGSREKTIQKLFKTHYIDADLITDDATEKELAVSMKKDAWYKGMDVDKLSIEEASVIAESLTEFAREKGLITTEEKALIKADFEEYFKKELVKVRTYEEMESEDAMERIKQDGFAIYVKHIGQERAEKVAAYFVELEAMDDGCKDEKEGCEGPGGL